MEAGGSPAAGCVAIGTVAGRRGSKKEVDGVGMDALVECLVDYEGELKLSSGGILGHTVDRNYVNLAFLATSGCPHLRALRSPTIRSPHA